MALTFQPIIPKRYTSAKAGKDSLDQMLNTVGSNVQKAMQTYPAWRPWKNPPRSGPRAGGKRTGNYGRNWQYKVNSGKNVEVTNAVEYAEFVGGPKTVQARHMAARGWPSIDDVSKKVVSETVKKTKLKATA